MAKRRKQPKKTTRLNSIKDRVSDKRIPKILGVMILLLSLYLFVAFVSYLFTWKADQDQVLDFSWGLFFDQSLKVENLLGRFGAIVSNVFFYWGIGLASFISIFVLFKLGFLLLTGRSLQGIWSPFQYALTFILFFSPLLAFVFGNVAFPWGGAFGTYVSSWLVKFVGTLGTALLFVFLGVAFFVWNFHHITERSTFS
ncbi:MAG: DNA translocase FtsK 4TM domain-containing protein, partial [Saprospiraceae bacterium]|nr:DNA translocase FtsK 4TM domain-containing protein [Saprospiraceae bacterium]